MADVVNYYLERMLPELEDLERRGLFTRSEIKEIVRRRREFEYQIKRKSKVKDDFLRYIEYEKCLEALRIIRKKVVVKSMKAVGEKWTLSASDRSSVPRICNIYYRAVTKFKGDLNLWLQYLEYCKKNSKSRMQRVLAKALQLHPHVPGLWMYAAAWDFEHNRNVSAARTLMQRGLRLCPHSEALWLEYLRMELTNAQLLRARKLVLGINSDNDPTNKLARAVYKSAVAAVPASPKFRQSFVEVLDGFDLIESSLKDDICNSIVQDFPCHEQSWDWKARRCLNSGSGFSCRQVYEEALRTVSSALMYELYAEFLEGLIDEELEDVRELVGCLLQVFESAEEKCPSFKLVDGHVRLLCREGLVDKAKNVVLKFCTGSLSGCAKLWTLRLSLQTQSAGAQQDQVLKTFKQALKKVDTSESQELWQMGLEYFSSRDPEFQNVLHLLEVSLGRQGGGQVLEGVAAAAIDFCLHCHGIEKARQLYNRFLVLPGPSLQLFEHCISIEARTAAVGDTEAVAFMRKLFDAAAEIYGKCNTDLWLAYCAQERKVGTPDAASNVYSRAKKALVDPALFIQKHHLMFS